MIGASLAAAKTVQPKKKYLRMADGTEYRIPANADQSYIDQVVAYHNATAAPAKKAVKEGGQKVSDTLTGMFGKATEKQPSGGLFAKTGTATKEGLAEAEKYAASKGVNLKPGQSSAMQRKAIGNVASAKAADLIEPVTGPASDFLANLATWIDPLAGFAEKKKPGSVKGAAKSMIEGVVTGPIQSATSAGVITDPTATWAERGLSGAELARDALFATTHITLPKVGGALKKIFKGAEKAAVLEKGAFVPKDLEGYTSPSNLSEAGVTLKTGENPAVAAKKAELDARRAARNAQESGVTPGVVATKTSTPNSKPVGLNESVGGSVPPSSLGDQPRSSNLAQDTTPVIKSRVIKGERNYFYEDEPGLITTDKDRLPGMRKEARALWNEYKDSPVAWMRRALSQEQRDWATQSINDVVKSGGTKDVAIQNFVERAQKGEVEFPKNLLTREEESRLEKLVGEAVNRPPYPDAESVRQSLRSQVKVPTEPKPVSEPSVTAPKATPSENVNPTQGKKEPWEVSASEFEAESRKRFKNFRGDTSPLTDKEIGAPPSETHRFAVESALKEGKPVPKEVLADYPDLAAKYGKKEPAVSTQGMTGTIRGHHYAPPSVVGSIESKGFTPSTSGEMGPGVYVALKEGYVTADRFKGMARINVDIPENLFRVENWGNDLRKIGYNSDEVSAILQAKAKGDWDPVHAAVKAKGFNGIANVESGKAVSALVFDSQKVSPVKEGYGYQANKRKTATDKVHLGPTKANSELEQGGPKGIQESNNSGTVAPTQNTPKAPEAPQKPVQSPETASVTGLANQVQDREALNGIINEVEPTKGKGAEDWQGVGKKSVDAGEIDPEQLAARIGSGEEELTGKKVGALLEGKRKLMNALNSAKPGEEYLKAKEKLDTYLQNVQQGKGRWSDVGRALQAGTELDTGNFAQVIEAVQKQGAKLNPKMEEQLRGMTEKVKAAEAKLSETERLLKEEQAKRTTASQAKKSPRFSKEALDEELDQLLKEFVQKTAKASAGIDPELLPIMGRIAVNYMKRGVNTLDDVVAAVQSHFKEATYEDIVSGIDAATKGTTRTRSELQKEITRLKSQAKSDVKARTQIKSLQEQLRTGDYEVPTKRESTITKRVEDLRLERDLLSNEVKSRVGETKPRTGWQTVTNVLNAPKSIKSSIDISAAGRQGWFLGAANPDKIPAAFADQLKAMASPKGALKAQNALLERPNASKYKRMGLYIAPLEGHGEEAFKGTVFPKWSKLNPFQGSSRAYTAYLNRMRVDVADRLIKWAGPNATDDDLKVIGNFINTASGRGGKSIHLEGKIAESLNNVFFSPRFVASRFELALGQPLMTAQGKLGKSLKARALVAQQYAATLGTIGSIVALAKHMNPDMNTTDPTKPDYMSPKIGDTKIDVLAGLRQTVNLGAKLLDRDRNEFQKGADVGRFIRSKASPAAGSAYSLYTGKDYIGQPYGIKDALTDLVSPLSVQELVEGAKKDGWNQDDFLGMLNFLGFNTQTYKPKEDKKEHPN